MKFNRERVIFLIIILIIAWLIFQVAFGIRPFNLFREVKNTTRWNHLKLIGDAVYFYFLREGKFPDCILEPGQKISINQCSELRDYLTQFPQDPDPKHEYLIEYLNQEKNRIKVYSTAPEAEGISIIK